MKVKKTESEKLRKEEREKLRNESEKLQKNVVKDAAIKELIKIKSLEEDKMQQIFLTGLTNTSLKTF